MFFVACSVSGTVEGLSAPFLLCCELFPAHAFVPVHRNCLACFVCLSVTGTLGCLAGLREMSYGRLYESPHFLPVESISSGLLSQVILTCNFDFYGFGRLIFRVCFHAWFICSYLANEHSAVTSAFPTSS